MRIPEMLIVVCAIHRVKLRTKVTYYKERNELYETCKKHMFIYETPPVDKLQSPKKRISPSITISTNTLELKEITRERHL